MKIPLALIPVAFVHLVPIFLNRANRWAFAMDSRSYSVGMRWNGEPSDREDQVKGGAKGKEDGLS